MPVRFGLSGKMVVNGKMWFIGFRCPAIVTGTRHRPKVRNWKVAPKFKNLVSIRCIEGICFLNSMAIDIHRPGSVSYGLLISTFGFAFEVLLKFWNSETWPESRQSAMRFIAALYSRLPTFHMWIIVQSVKFQFTVAKISDLIGNPSGVAFLVKIARGWFQANALPTCFLTCHPEPNAVWRFKIEIFKQFELFLKRLFMHRISVT